jgi:hypothetical protein
MTSIDIERLICSILSSLLAFSMMSENIVPA